MKGIICYYSNTGNTKLACQYIKKSINNADFDLFNLITDGVPDFSQYDIAGFATFTDYFSPAKYFYQVFENFDKVNNKPAFVLNTYGFISGRTLKDIAILAEKKGFDVISGFSLHTPENYPPLIAKGKTFDKYPKAKDINKFDNFIAKLSHNIELINKGKKIQYKKINVDLFGKLFPEMNRKKSKEEMGEIFVDPAGCSECGLCQKKCPYGAIELKPKPVFDYKKCYGCWSCFNHCSKKAIHTKKIKGKGHYPKPLSQLAEKLK